MKFLRNFRLQRSWNYYLSSCQAHGQFNVLKCWNCSKETKSAFFCEHCNRIQPVVAKNFFNYVDLPTKFELDEESLKKRFHKLQLSLHPDKFAHASDVERSMSEGHSRMLNNAMLTLGDKLERAKYLLETEGKTKIEEDEKAYLDPEELMEVFDWQESINEMEEECMLQEEKNNILKEINSIFSELGNKISASEWPEAKRLIVRLQYLYRIKETVNLKIEKSFSRY